MRGAAGVQVTPFQTLRHRVMRLSKSARVKVWPAIVEEAAILDEKINENAFLDKWNKAVDRFSAK